MASRFGTGEELFRPAHRRSDQVGELAAAPARRSASRTRPTMPRASASEWISGVSTRRRPAPDPGATVAHGNAGCAVNAGLADGVGSLTPGKQADVVLIRPSDVALPAADPVGAVTAFATARDVDTVLVAGQVRKRHGHLVGVDVDAARALASAARDRLLAAG